MNGDLLASTDNDDKQAINGHPPADPFWDVTPQPADGQAAAITSDGAVSTGAGVDLLSGSPIKAKQVQSEVAGTTTNNNLLNFPASLPLLPEQEQADGEKRGSVNLLDFGAALVPTEQAGNASEQQPAVDLFAPQQAPDPFVAAHPAEDIFAPLQAPDPFAAQPSPDDPFAPPPEPGPLLVSPPESSSGTVTSPQPVPDPFAEMDTSSAAKMPQSNTTSAVPQSSQPEEDEAGKTYAAVNQESPLLATHNPKTPLAPGHQSENAATPIMQSTRSTATSDDDSNRHGQPTPEKETTSSEAAPPLPSSQSVEKDQIDDPSDVPPTTAQQGEALPRSPPANNNTEEEAEEKQTAAASSSEESKIIAPNPISEEVRPEANSQSVPKGEHVSNNMDPEPTLPIASDIDSKRVLNGQDANVDDSSSVPPQTDPSQSEKEQADQSDEKDASRSDSHSQQTVLPPQQTEWTEVPLVASTEPSPPPVTPQVQRGAEEEDQSNSHEKANPDTEKPADPSPSASPTNPTPVPPPNAQQSEGNAMKAGEELEKSGAGGGESSTRASLPPRQPKGEHEQSAKKGAESASSDTPSTPARQGSSGGTPPNEPNTPQTAASNVSTLEKLAPLTPNPTRSSKISPDTPLPQRVEWLEKELHAAHTLIMKLQHPRDKEEAQRGEAIMVELQTNLQGEMTNRAEAEDAARLATAQAKKLDEQLASLRKDAKAQIGKLKEDFAKVSKEKSDMQVEFEDIREERDEQARKEAALTNRLNAAKKKEAVKANAAEHYEDQVDYLGKQVTQYKEELTTVTTDRDQLKKEVAEWKQYAEQRTLQLESALNDEKKLNDERKRKMKGFVEAKTEEVRSAKADNISLQTELDQTNRSLKELNQRYKQVHAQWVQSQTRNRELQRDMTKTMKDSETMSKVGGTLEAKLSRSALETEDHKNKRLVAKHELMAVLRQLEAERDVNSRLRESIKVTFTPKALSQQQTIQETLDEFEGALQKLATRLGRPLPPPPVAGNDLLVEMMSEQTVDAGAPADDQDEPDENVGERGKPSMSEVSTTRVLSKLESETQRVSQCIMSLTGSVERMHALLDSARSRGCVDALQQLLLTRSPEGASNEERAAMTGSRRISRGPRYGQVPGTLT